MSGKGLSRRDFLKSTAAGAGALAAASLLGACSTETKSELTFADTIEWNAEYDVIVVGFGGAGAVASITAAREGAKTLLIEKAVQGDEGGNTRISCNFMAGVTDPDLYLESTIKHNNYLYTDTIDEETMRAAAVAMKENAEWLESIGGIVDIDEPPFAKGTGGCFFMIQDHDKEGNVLGYGNKMGDEKRYWNLVHINALKQEGLDIWYSTSAKHLIQDPFTKTILGVTMDRDGKMINVRAKNGVILTCGGFENNRELAQNYLNRPYIYPLGTRYNTGDGIYMVQEVGAALWHMSNLSGPDITILNPDTDTAVFTTKQKDAYGVSRDQRANPLPGYNMIMVGPDGSRFMSESTVGSHGRVNVAGEKMLLQFPSPMYAIFDEETKTIAKFTNTWESDNNAEIEPWAVIADSIEELAEKMGMDNLVAQVEEYNRYAEQGNDPKYGRDPAQMKPIKTGPFYALKCVPAVYNTQGGARRNGNAEVLAVDGSVIPHLYSAGEFGAIWPAYYGGGMNIAETCAFGRIAGKNAAKEKEALPAINLTKVESKIDNSLYTEEDHTKEFKCGENQYIGRAWGVGGKEIVVRVTYSNETIHNVEVLQNVETWQVGTYPMNIMPKQMVEQNTVDVDAVTGATVTSNALKEAVRNAIAQAK